MSNVTKAILLDETGQAMVEALEDIAGALTPDIDDTLTQTGRAADAKAVGDALALKQGVISDLAAIRTGAAAGAAAVQTEEDPTVPAWAKAPTKPTYTAAEIGALSAANIDATLTEEGAAADAKAAGDEIGEVRDAVTALGLTIVDGMLSATYDEEEE